MDDCKFEICRVCLQIIKGNSYAHRLSEDQLRQKLLWCFPELLNIDVIVNAFLCDYCYSNLQVTYNFKAQCLAADTKITRYMQAVPMSNVLNLKDLITANVQNTTPAFGTYAAEMPPVNSNRYNCLIKKEECVYGDASATDTECVRKLGDTLSSVLLGAKERVTSTIYADYLAENVRRKEQQSGGVRKKRMRLRFHGDVGKQKYACNFCEESFKYAKELVEHMKVHGGAKAFKCDECDNFFTTKDVLVKHFRTHTGEKPYACEFCQKRFSVSDTLVRHRRLHTGEKPYKCGYCADAFRRRDHLNRHLRSVHDCLNVKVGKRAC